MFFSKKKGEILTSNQIRKNAEEEISRLKKEISQTQYIDGVRERELYKSLFLRNKNPEYFHTVTEKIRDTEIIPTFEYPKPKNYEDFYNHEQANDEIEEILTNDAFYVKENANSSDFNELNKKNFNNIGKKQGFGLDDVEIYRANEFRLEALETGSPREELERLDRELFNFYKKKGEEENSEEDERYHRLVDPLLDRIKFPEKYDKNANQYL